jgi:hypothetical protein
MMERLFISILFGGMFASMASGGALDSIDLNAYQWKHRLLFLFVPSENDPSYLSLKKEIEHQAKEVLDRDLLIAYVLEKGEGRLGMERLSSGQGFSLRKNLSVPPGQFTTILVGKDGGEKFRQTGVIRLKEIFQIIDAMPMRQQEMKKK